MRGAHRKPVCRAATEHRR